jgi:hypothetical protein
MGRGIAALVVAGLALTADRRAAAADAAPIPAGLEGAALLDARAPIFAAIHPTEIGDGFALIDLLGGVFPEAMRAVNHLRDSLGLYAFSRGELADSGLDPDALVLASWGIADADEGPARKRDAARSVVVRDRFVLKLIDGERFIRAANSILSAGSSSFARFGGVTAQGAPAGGGPAPAWASGHEVRALAKRTGLALLARWRDGSLVAVRLAGDLAIVDYSHAWGAGASPLEPAGVLSKMLAAPAQPLSATLKQGTRGLLSTKDVSVALVVEPGALAPLLPRASCRRDWTSADGALFQDAAVLLHLHPFQWRLEVVWGMTPLGRARLAGTGSDDGLLDGHAAAGDGIAAMGLTLEHFDAIRGLPRPGALGGIAERATEALDACGAPAWLVAGARFWPQLAALQLERLIAPVATKGGEMPGALRNVAAVVRELPASNRPWERSTALFGSLPAAVEGSVGDALTHQASGRPETQSFGQRLPRFYDLSAGTGFSEAGVERLAGGHVALALTPQASGLGWYYRLPRRPAKTGPQSKIGYLHLNLARLLESWAEEADPGTRAAVRLAAGQLGQLGGDMVLDGDWVRLELNLSGSQ